MNTRVIRLRRTLYGIASFTFNHLIWIFSLLVLTLVIFVGYKAKVYLDQMGLANLSLVSFFKSPDKQFANTAGRTNFLILGIRGEGADSPDLTDTMLVISYSYKDKAATLISIPRDLWVNSLKTKINSTYHYGRFQEPNGGGLKLVSSAVLETLGLPIHYTAVIDFSLFQQAIDIVGGIDVNVATTFIDSQYPIAGKENVFPIESRFETITFAAGLQHMDGTTALKFVRSRHADGDEGTDIARDRRQQLIIAALKQKVISPKFLLDRQKITNLYNLFKSHMDTNISESLYPSLARLAFDSYRKPVKEIILNYQPDTNGFAILENPIPSSAYLNQWVLVSRDNNWPALQQYVQNKLSGSQ